MNRILIILISAFIVSCSSDSSEYYNKALKECPKDSKIGNFRNGLTGGVMQYYCTTKDGAMISIGR